MNTYMDFDDLRRALLDIKYRQPGFTLELFRHPYEGYLNLCLAIRFTVPNSYSTTGEMQTQCVNVPIPPIYSDEHFLDWLRWRLGAIANHEVSEMFWLGNAPMHDPHSTEYWELRA